jgi:hypothetical protein
LNYRKIKILFSWEDEALEAKVEMGSPDRLRGIFCHLPYFSYVVNRACVDSIGCRSELEAFARRFLIPLIDIGMDVHESSGEFSICGQAMLSMPGKPCMRCMGLVTDERLAEEAARYGAAGRKPQVVWPNGTLASIAVGFFMKLVAP